MKRYIRRHKVLTAFAVGGLALFVFFVWPTTYSASPLTATVVDRATGKPIEGVAVVANWAIRGGWSFPESQIVGQATVMEAVTDKDGQFHFPAWGPKLIFFHDSVDGSAPQLTLYKPGYVVRTLYNYPSDPWTPWQQSDWNGRTIALSPIHGMDARATHEFETINSALQPVFRTWNGCAWQTMPNMLRYLAREWRSLQHRHVSYIGPNIVLNLSSGKWPSDCLSPQKLIERS